MAPEVARRLLVAVDAVNTTDEFTPAEDLPDKPFYAFDRQPFRRVTVEDGCDDLVRRQQAEIQGRAQRTMEYGCRSPADGVFVGPELRQALVEKIR